MEYNYNYDHSNDQDNEFYGVEDEHLIDDPNLEQHTDLEPDEIYNSSFSD